MYEHLSLSAENSMRYKYALDLICVEGKKLIGLVNKLYNIYIGE